MDLESYTTLFRETYMAKVAQGLTPNEAAAKTLEELQHMTPSVDMSAESSPVTTTQPLAQHDAVMTNTSVEINTGDGGIEDVEMTEAADMAPKPEAPILVPAPTATTPVMKPSLSHVSMGKQLKEELYAAAEVDEYREVKRLIFQVFSDIHTLNIAFSTNVSVDPYEEWWQVDREEMMEVYALLVDALGRSKDQIALQNTWRNALETMVSQPWNVCSSWTQPEQLRFLLILFEHPLLFDPDYIHVTGGICKLFYHLSSTAKDLVRYQWNTYWSHEELYRMLQLLQQTITVCLYGTKKMDIAYAACAVLQEIQVLNSTQLHPFATYHEFYNDAVNSEVDIVQDYSRSLFYLKKAMHGLDTSNYKKPHRMLSELSFCDFPFVLDAASKSRVLHVDSDLEQRLRQNDALFTRTVSPYLILKIRRAHVIEDAMKQLVTASTESLKKPLKVKFIGEEGIDEGGVRKEFFQILIRQLLDPAFGMFIYDSETHTMWFNCDSLEATMEFELIGMLLGLAIYNAVILDLHFPHVVYKKLMATTSTQLEDVEQAMPALGKGLRQLLEFEGNVEEVYQRNFEYSYEIFGEVKTIELKEGGSAIPVTNANRQEYVDLYVDFVLNRSVSRQYDAFHKGFHLVFGESAVLRMFQWEELHLLICGSSELDFEALEQSTSYDDGYTKDSDTIKYFWSVVHEFTLEEKKKLLMFTTGSDRVPIRGLSNLMLVISRNGSDSDRLPTAHTCFNHLLLPEYSTREKLKNRLLLAINQSEGFGLR